MLICNQLIIKIILLFAFPRVSFVDTKLDPYHSVTMGQEITSVIDQLSDFR